MKLWLMLIWAKRMVNDLGARTPNLCYYVSHDKVFSYMYEDILLIIQPCKYILVSAHLYSPVSTTVQLYTDHTHCWSLAMNT